MKRPFIHLLETPCSYYFFDVNTNTLQYVDKSVYAILKNIEDGRVENYCEVEELQPLISNGFLSDFRPLEIRHPDTDKLEYLLDRRINKLTLQVTQACNLRCSYCIYSEFNKGQRSHGNKFMSLDMAKKGIDFLIRHSIDSEQVNVGFYGGEPLLAFGLIKEIVGYIKERYSEKNISYAITTNGTLLTEEMIRFMIENEFMITVSLDGPEEIHNINRRYAANGMGSFSDVMKNLERLCIANKENNSPHQISTNMVIDPQNDLDDINSLFEKNKIMDSISSRAGIVDDAFSQGKTTFTEAFFEKNNYEKFLGLIAHFKFVSDLYVYPTAMQEVDEAFSKLEKEQHTYRLSDELTPSGPCIPGQRRLFVSVDGELYPCERVSETSQIMQIGTLDTGFDVNKCKILLNVGQLTAEKCKNCWALKKCTICAKAIDNNGSLSKTKKVSVCTGVYLSAERSLKLNALVQDVSRFYYSNQE